VPDLPVFGDGLDGLVHLEEVVDVVVTLVLDIELARTSRGTETLCADCIAASDVVAGYEERLVVQLRPLSL
jgi:hypothetical protein